MAEKASYCGKMAASLSVTWKYLLVVSCLAPLLNRLILKFMSTQEAQNGCRGPDENKAGAASSPTTQVGKARTHSNHGSVEAT